jgi:hypothetical protein
MGKAALSTNQRTGTQRLGIIDYAEHWPGLGGGG